MKVDSLSRFHIIKKEVLLMFIIPNKMDNIPEEVVSMT